MNLRKIRHPVNFDFIRKVDSQGRFSLGPASERFVLADLGDDVFRLRVLGRHWPINHSQAELDLKCGGPSSHALLVDPHGHLTLRRECDGAVLLTGAPGGTFGHCGDAWLFEFELDPQTAFFGWGEHSLRLNKRGQRTKFWHTDLFGDYAHCEIVDGTPNPMYASIPWVIAKRGNEHVGLLLNHPADAFMDLGSNFIWDEANAEDRNRRSFFLGAPSGQPDLFVLVGPSLAQVVAKLQKLVGPTPRPPLWALGYHQCRWGYRGPRDLLQLDREFRRHRIPCDGLWLDIDYMDRFKVFTWSPQEFKQVRRELARLRARGRRVVPILDPGVKVEPGYSIYDEGIRKGFFCLSPRQRPYVGFVWPGFTHFPDFSRAEVRAWWAGHVRDFARLGVDGTWIDMNDPSVGDVELEDMRFDHGRKPHGTYHNQYALGMAKATHAGFLAARPNQRPFIISRSAFLSSSRYTAVWAGDNVSNWHHLRLMIPTCLSLALSGIPFCGADVAGFAGDTDPALAVAWYQASFLFPFFRNHSQSGTRRQEPWALGDRARRTIAHYIRLRYKFLPYLYQLFIAQERAGEGIVRPLGYDFEDAPDSDFANIDDQMMVGPSLLHAPILRKGAQGRRLVLPGNLPWFGLHDGRWHRPGRRAFIREPSLATPLFLREGALVPLQRGTRWDQKNDLSTVELHCALLPDSNQSAALTYVYDDGETLDYQRGQQTSVVFQLRAQANQSLELEVAASPAAVHRLRVCLVFYEQIEFVGVTQSGRQTRLRLRPYLWTCCGRPLSGWMTNPFLV